MIPIVYDELKSFDHTTYYHNFNFLKYEIAAVKLNEKWGFIDKTGNVVIPIKYDSVYDFSNNQISGIASVKLNGKWGGIDITDKIVIPIKYDKKFHFFNDGRLGGATVCVANKYGFINDRGQEIIQPIYDFIDNLFDSKTGKIKAVLNDKFLYFDIKGNQVDK